MTVDLQTILSESVDRMLSKGGAIVYLLEVAVNLLLFVGVVTIASATVEWLLQEVGDELSATERAELEAMVADEFALAIDAISVAGAVALIGLALLAWVAVMIVAFRTFGQGAEATGIGPLDGFGLACLNLIGALVLYALFAFFGLLALVVGAIVVSVLLFYYFPAIVIGEANALSGLRESVSIVTDEPGTTIVLWVVLVGVLIAFSIVGSVFDWILPPGAGDLATILFASAGYVAYYAVAARAYVGFRT